MVNQIMIANAPPAPVQRSDAASSSARNSSSQDGQTADAFGSALTKQIDEKSTASAANEAKNAKGKVSQNNTAQPDIAVTPDAASIALTMLGNQGIKTAFAGSKTSDAGKSADQVPQAAAPDATTNPMLIPGNPEIRVSTGNGVTPAVSAATSTAIRAAGPAVNDPTGVKFAQNTGSSNPDVAVKTGAASLKIAESALPTSQFQLVSAQAQLISAQPPITAPAQQNSAANNTISAPLGSSAWSTEFSQKISWMGTQQNQVAELHLNPPDLGPMHVVISVTDNQATALFTSPHSAVRDAIENALPKLRESMADNGIMLGNATVSDQTPRDSGAGNFMNHRGGNSRTEIAGTAQPAPITMPLMPTSRHNGMVDTFA
jgi:flagellar hook-length control protein FliK